MGRFATGSAFQFGGRTFEGALRGFDGKPFHPPLTDLPIGAYVLAPLMDLIAFFGGDASWARDLHVAAGYTLLGGAAFSVPTALTGVADWLRMRPGSEVRRITNSHALLMVVVTGLVAANLVWRFTSDDERTDAGLLVLSLAALLLVTAGGVLGGSLVYDKGYRVRKRVTSPDSPPPGEAIPPG